jgi:hypothetical protein
MAVKFLFFLGVIVATFLLASHNTAHAKELIEAKGLRLSVSLSLHEHEPLKVLDFSMQN